MFDVFYSGTKPNLFAHEREADSIEHAQKLSRTRYFWWIHYLADLSDWDFLWEPAPWQANQRHAWPDQHQPDSGIYLVPTTGYKDTNYHTDRYIHRLPNLEYWHVPEWINPSSIDWQWSPDPMEPPYIYEFPVEWGWDNVCGPEYKVPGATERKFVHDFVARTKPNPLSWYQHCHADFPEELYRWRPNPMDPPYDYVFGNQWYTAEIMPTVEYRMLGANSKKYITELKANLPERHTNHWHTIEDCEWDYSWVPDPGDPPYIYVFGNQWHTAEIMPTLTYTVPGATEKKYMDYPRACLFESLVRWDNLTEHSYSFDYSWIPDPGEPPMVYVFGNQHWPAEKMPMLHYLTNGADEESPIKYMDYPRATLLPNKTLWQLPQGVKEEQVDFTWVPDPGEPPYIYQFATQHQKTGGPIYAVPGAIETKYLEHVEIKIETTTIPIIEIDHLDGNAGNIPDTIKRIRYFDNYRDTLIRLAKSLLGQHEFVWVCSSICDYSGFDFSWHPEKWQGTMLHVFASNEQKFGDTFYMHVPTFAARAEKKALLEWYSVNYVPRVIVPRNRMPVIEHADNSQVDIIKTTDWDGPLALFTTTGLPLTIPAISLWRTEVKTIVPLSAGASAVIVPKVAKGDIKTQLYDYPYVDKAHRNRHYDQPLDIVFISNGENEADFLYQWLVDSVGGNSFVNGSHRIKHVENVKGRVAAYQAAANASTTPWFFAVFAKLQVNKEFDWNWQPDRMQQPKHYIFHAINPVNGLTYGHQAMIAYNKKLVLENPGLGLDFTLDQAHEVVPIVSGQANYYTSDWMAWRTAFREVLKLRASLPDIENEYRLRQWLTVDNTQAKWSMKGAEDAVEFYEAVNGNPTELKKSYEWDWLASYAFVKRSLVAN